MAKLNLSEYLDTPGFYVDSDDDLIVVNDNEETTYLTGSNRTESVNSPEDTRVEPVEMVRFYAKKPAVPAKKAESLKIDP